MLTGEFMGALGLPVHAFGDGRPGHQPGQWFYNLNALVLGALAVGHGRRRCSRCAADGPGTPRCSRCPPRCSSPRRSTGTCSRSGWRCSACYAWARRPTGAGRGPARAGRRGEALAAVPARPDALPGASGSRRAGPVATAIGSASSPSSSSTHPVVLAYLENWDRFFELNRERAIDWGTSGTSATTCRAGGRHVRRWPRSNGSSQHIPTLNLLTYALFGLACARHRRAGRRRAHAAPAWPSWPSSWSPRS